MRIGRRGFMRAAAAAGATALVSAPVGASDALPSLVQVRAELFKRSLYRFVVSAWPMVEPDREFVTNWHIRRLCRALERMEAGEAGWERVIANVPPGTMKSLIVSVIFPCWVWARRPGARFLLASYSADLTRRDNLRAREILRSPWYQQHFPELQFSGDQNAKERFNTTSGGWRIATSVCGLGTGEHPDYVIIDDPTTADQARSDVERKRANEWFDRTISTRGVTRGQRIIVIMQRLHESDLAGHLLAKGGWKHICWPMEYIPSRPATDSDRGHTADPDDPRTVAGELLWSALFTPAKVAQLKIDLGPYGAAGQLQQQPSPEGGGLFQKAWFTIVDAAPAHAIRARGWDTAASDGKGDWTVGVKIAHDVAAGKFYVEGVERGQWSPAQVDETFLQTAQLDGRACRQREEKEGGSSGATVIASRLQALTGYDYSGVTVSGDKVTRARPFRAQCEGRNVFLVRGPWNHAYLEELAYFPNGDNDDQVDASSAAFNELALGYGPPTRGKIRG